MILLVKTTRLMKQPYVKPEKGGTETEREKAGTSNEGLQSCSLLTPAQYPLLINYESTKLSLIVIA